jgi:hypothetical protein
MQTEYESTTSVEMIGPDGAYREVILKIGLHCTSKGFAGHFSPVTGWDAPYDPEFETTYIAFLTEKDKQVDLSEALADQLFGKEIIDQIMAKVNTEAIEQSIS